MVHLSSTTELIMIAITVDSVPLFLQKGSLYKSFDENDNGPFEIPSNCFKDNPYVDSEQDLVGILQTARYWGVDLPQSAVQFIVQSCAGLDFDSLSKEFPELQSMFQKVSKVKRVNASAKLLTAVSEGLSLPFVCAMVQLGYSLCAEACEAAATLGDLEILMYLHSEGCPWDERTTTAAATNNHLACLEYALDFHCPLAASIVTIIANGGNLPVLKLLLTASDVALTPEAVSSTLTGDHVNCQRYLHAQGCALPPTHTAALYGAFECMKYLHEQGVAWHMFTCFNAAKAGHLKCLTYAHTHGSFPLDCCAAAAAGGHLDCLKYLRENGCPWDENTFKCAVLFGSWKCAKYAYNHHCPMPRTYLVVLAWGLFAVVLLKVLLMPYVDPIYNRGLVAFFFASAVGRFKSEYGFRQLHFMGYNRSAWTVEITCGVIHAFAWVVIVFSVRSLYDDWR